MEKSKKSEIWHWCRLLFNLSTLFRFHQLSQYDPFCSIQFSHSVVSNSLPPHGLQHARHPCPPPSPGVCANSCASGRRCHPASSSSSHLRATFASVQVRRRHLVVTFLVPFNLDLVLIFSLVFMTLIFWWVQIICFAEYFLIWVYLTFLCD